MVDLIESLGPLFAPRHVAVIGASRTPGKRGHTVVRNLLRCGFTGRISPVNPAGGDVEGLPCYPSVFGLPEPADCAFVALPAQQSVEAVRQCATGGVRAVVVGSSGFAETGTREGADWEAELKAIARQHGMRMIGPNTNGIFNANARFSLGYNHSHSEPILAGAISIASHSGAMFDGIAGRLRKAGVGLAKFVPVGNETDLDLLDLFEYFIADSDTRVIGLVVEGLSNGRRFRELAAQAADAGKPVVALKIGRSAVGAEASLAHSSRLAGSARAYDALFAASAIASVRTIEGLVGSCALLAGRKSPPAPEDRRIVCVTASGAGGALVADFAEQHGLPLAGNGDGGWEEPAASAIASLPTNAKIRNPIDTGSLGNWQLLATVFAHLKTAGYDGPLVVYAHNMPERRLEEQLAAVLAERRRQIDAPVIMLAPGGLSAGMETIHRRNGALIFNETASCFESLAAYDYAVNRAPLVRRSGPVDVTGQYADARRLLKLAALRQMRFLSEVESGDVLRVSGIPMVESRLVRSGEVAAAAADVLHYPVVLKALVPGVAHKHERGFVITGVADRASVLIGHAMLLARLAGAGLDQVGAAIVVQPMLASKAELIVGVSHEPNVGHFLVVGLGGVMAEMLDRVTLIPVPCDNAAMRDLLEGSLVAAMMERLDPKGVLMDQLIGVLESLQRLAGSHGDMIESVDINPLLITATGLTGVDALVVLRTEATDPSIRAAS